MVISFVPLLRRLSLEDEGQSQPPKSEAGAEVVVETRPRTGSPHRNPSRGGSLTPRLPRLPRIPHVPRIPWIAPQSNPWKFAILAASLGPVHTRVWSAHTHPPHTLLHTPPYTVIT
jgi:hypothetical protein